MTVDLPVNSIASRHSPRPRNSRAQSRQRWGRSTARALLVISVSCLASTLWHSWVRASSPDAAFCVLQDGQSFAAALSDVAAGGDVVFAEMSGPRTVARQDLVVWGAYAERSQATQLVLTDGSVVVADILSIESEAVVIVGRLWQEMRLPRSVIRAIVFHPPADPLARDQLLFRILAKDRQDERLLLENGDELDGRLPEVVRPDAGAFQVTHIGWNASDSEQSVDVPLDRVIAVLLATTEAHPPSAGDADTLVGLNDGSLIHAQAMQRSARTLEFRLVAGPQLITEPFATPEREPWTAVIMLQPLRAGVTYVSDLEPLGYRHIPFLDVVWPFRRDQSVAGGRLRHGGRIWPKGLGMHSSSRLAYDLGGRFRELHAEVAIDERSGRQGSVVFRVYVQGGKAAEGQTGTGTTEETTADQWSMAYESAIVRGGDPALPIRVDLRQAQRMALIVDWADRADQWDHATWLNARLVK